MNTNLEILIFDKSQPFVTACKNLGLHAVQQEVKYITCEAVVSPANSFGFMDGGIDYAYSELYGWDVQSKLKQKITELPFGELLVGQALAIETEHPVVKYVISAPTMRVPKKIYDPMDVTLAVRAAVYLAMEMKLPSVAIPGMGTGCGELPSNIAARAILSGIQAATTNVPVPKTWQEAQFRHFSIIP